MRPITIDVNQIGRSNYYPAAREATWVILKTSHRDPAEIEILGEPDNLREYVDEEAVDTLLDAGLSIEGERRRCTIGPLNLGTISTEQFNGRVIASPEVIGAVLDLYHPFLRHVHFLDEHGDVIAGCYERFQNYWLTEDEYSEAKSQLPEEIAAALRPIEES